MSTGVTNLFDLATQLLAAVVAGFEQADVPLPAVRYVTGVANPVGGVESLVVSYSRIYHGMPAGASGGQYPVKHLMTPRSVELTVWLIRALTDTLTSQGVAEAMSVADARLATYDAQVLMTDSYVLAKTIVVANASGQLGVDGTSVMGLSPVVPLNAAGGLGGCRVDLSYELV